MDEVTFLGRIDSHFIMAILIIVHEKSVLKDSVLVNSVKINYFECLNKCAGFENLRIAREHRIFSIKGSDSLEIKEVDKVTVSGQLAWQFSSDFRA